MFTTRRVRTVLYASAVMALTAGLAGCKDDPAEPDDEPDIASIRLTVGNQTVTITETGTVTGGPIVIPLGNTAITAVALLPNGQVEPKVTAAEFRLDVTSDNSAIATFSRGGSFNGNIVGVARGSTQLRFSFFHLLEGHDDFGPHPVSVTVQ